MVEENFKIGIDLDIAQDSLEDVTRKVRKAIEEAFKGIKVTAPLAGGSATVRSMREASKVSAAAHPQELMKALGSKDAKQALEKLDRTLKEEEKTKKQGIATSKKVEKSEDALAKANEDLAAAREEEARRTRQVSREGGSFILPTSKTAKPGSVAEQQRGPTNIRIGANIDVRRAAGSQRTAGGGTGGGGNPKAAILGDAPREKTGKQAYQSPVEKQAEKGSRYEAGASAVAKEVHASIQDLRSAIVKAAGGKVDEKFFERIGLAGAVKTGPGASPVVERTGKNAEHIGRTIQIVDNKLSHFSNVITDRIRELTSTGGAERFGRMARTGARDKGAFEAQARQMVGEVFGGLTPVEKGKPLAGFQKGGEANLTVKLSGALQERLSALEDEASVIGELNKILWQASQGVGELADEFAKLKAAGVDVMTTFGLSESIAAKAQVVRGERETPGKLGPVEEVTLPVQTRNLAAMGLGGAGSMRPARSFQPQQIMELMGGGVPSVMGAGEREAYKTGLYKPGAYKEAKTALVDPGVIPELFEDQILFDPNLLKMPIKQVRSMLVHELAEGITEGASLAQGQTLGTQIGGEGILFDKKGMGAKVKAIEKAVVDGMEAYRIEVEEINETITGMKLTERSGIKGIAKAVPNLAEKYGLPEGTAAAISTSAVARRGSLRLPIEMMSNTIADASGVAAQEIADKIVAAMSEGGQEFAAAIKQVAEAYGLKGFTGAEVVTKGPIAESQGGRASIMTGKVALGRLPKAGMRGPMDISERFFGASDVQGLKMSSQTASMAASMQENISRLTKEFGELRAVLSSLVGDADEAAAAVKDLSVILPESLKRLPQSAVAESDLKGTLLDPDLHQALALQLPTRGGADKLMRIPSAGSRPGERESFRTEIGTVGAGSMTRQFDRIMEQATKVRALRGQVPLTENADAMEEASNLASKAIRDQVGAIVELGIESKEGAIAADQFVQKMMPLIQMLGKGPSGIKFIGKGGEQKEIKRSAENYVKFLDEAMTKPREMKGQLFAAQDVMAQRAGGGSKVAGLGGVFNNLDVLNKVMEMFQVTLDGTSEAADQAMGRLEKLEETLTDMVAQAALSAEKTAPYKRSAAQAKEAGASLAPIGVAIEFPPDVSKELAAVGERLQQMKTAGADVDEALSAFGRMSALQTAQKGIPKDAVLINEEDWKNLVSAVSKKYKIPEPEAMERLQRTGLVSRYPVTGPRSFLPGKLTRVGEDVLPRGNLGVAGPAAVSSPEDLKAMLQPLMELKGAKLGRLEEIGGAGEEAKQLAAEITELSRVTSGLIPVFRTAGLNLDFDGDQITFHGDVAKRASSNLESFSDSTKKVINLQDAFIGILGKTMSKGGMGGAEEYSKFFGQVVKGRPEGMRTATLRPADEEMAGFEARAHIAGKKSVAILSDAFNSTLLAITTGSDKLGDAIEVSLGSMMLGINESLAQKHGTGGIAGPMEFLDMFQKGQIGKIQEGLKGKEGFLGTMGERNRQMKSQMREQMLVAGAGTGGMERLKDFFDAEGIGEKMAAELKKGNLTSIVDKAVEELDLGNVLKRMFEMMKINMIKAFTQGGMTLEQATGEVYDLLKPKGKTGHIKGINPTDILKEMVPGYALTRQRVRKKEVEPLDPREKAKKALALLPQRIAEQTGIDLQLEEPDIKEPAQALAQTLKSWLDGIRDKVEFITKERMKEMAGFEARGAYVYQKSAPTGGTVYARQDKLEQFEASLETLGQIAAGVVDPTKMSVDALRELRNNLKQLVETIGHENVHKYSKDWQSAVANIVRSLKSAQGVLALGGEQGEPVRRFIKGTPSVYRKYQRGRMAEMALERGATETRVPVAKGEGYEVIQNLTREKVAELMDAAHRAVAEELLANQFNPEKFAQVMGGEKGAAGVPEIVSNFLKNQLAMLTKARPEVLEAAMQAAQAINSGYLEGLIETAENAGPAQARAAASSRATSLLSFAGRGGFLKAQEVLGTQERGIMESRQIHKLSAAERLPSGQLGFGQMRKLGGADRPELAGVAQEVKAIQDAIIAGVAPEELNEMLRKVRGLAGKTSAIVSRLTKSGALSGVSPINEMVSVVQDFFMTVAQKMTTEARELQRAIADMESKGQVDTPEFGALLEKFDRKVVDINTWLEKASVERMGKHGQLAVGGVTSTKGEMLPGFKGLGLDVANVKNFEGVIAGMAGEGKEGARFASLFKDELIKAAEAARKGASATEIWSRIFSIMKQHPAEMKDDATKLAAIFAALGRIVGTQDQQFAQAATNLGEAGKNAKKMKDALEGISPKDYQQVAAAMAGASKTQKRAFARGMGTDQAGSVMEQQRSAMEAMEGRRKMLEKLIKTPDYKAMGAPRHFEKQQFDIVDPQTGQVIQKLSAEFKRMGSTVRASMSQAGAATAAFGNQLQNSLRRVVQWGFASGIIYGTVRAFHNLVSVLTTVDSKMAELKKVMNTSITDFGAMQDAAVGMAKGFGVAIEDVLDGMVVYAQQGLTMNETMERTRATLMAVNVTTLTSTEATDALTSVMKAFGDEVSDSMMAVDSWAAVAATTAVSAKDLAVAVQRSGSAAKASGVGFHDLLGLTASIGSVTRQSGAEVATGVKFMLRSMGRPAAQKSLLGVGVKSQDVTGNLKPSMDILGDLAGRWDKLSSSQKMNTAQAIAGIRHYNQFMVLMEHWTDALDASATSQTSQGFATRKNAIALQTFSKQMQTLRETVKSLAIDLGKVMLPAMNMVVSVVQKMVGALDLIPDPLKAIGVAGVASMLAFHKASDVVLDTLTAIAGTDIGDKVKGMGLGATAMSAAKGIGGMFKGITGPAKAPAARPGDLPYVKSLTEAMQVMGLAQASGEVGVLAKAFLFAKSTTLAWVSSLATLKGALITTGIGALVVALGFLTNELMKASKTGKETEDEMFDMIGRAQDTANALKSQGIQISKITHLWDKYASAVETAADPAKLRAAIGDGNFKSPLKALKDYQDAIYNTGTAFASLDPSMIEGITDTGEYIYTASDGMKALTVSAADAQNATVAAMQTKVIKAYADEITKAKGAWARFQEIISLGTKKMDLITQIGDVRDKIQELGKQMEELASQGISPSHLQSEMNNEVAKELELRGEILASADNLKRVLDQMPRFESSELAFTALSSKNTKTSMQALAASGGAGREATAGSLQMRGMARQVGLGGIVGTETTANAERVLQDLLERGIKTRQGAPTAAGQLGVMGPEAARLLLGAATGKTLKEGEKPQEIERARTVITGMDEMTGELVYYFENGLRGAIDKLDDSEVTTELRKAMETMFTMDRSALEEASERGRKLLTLQATGAMAGIRIPEGGMPNIGPGTFREMSVEQRVMGSLPDELERLATIQSELTEINKKYNESLGEGSDASEEYTGTLKNNINTMSKTTRDLVRAMKMEEFDLTNLAHIETAFQKLKQTLLDAGKAARDAAIEEETRADLLKHTSGAMAGLAVAPQLNFGKSFRELTAGERLQKEMGPGFARTLSKIAGVESKYSAGIQKTTDIRKQIGDFDEMNDNLAKARGTFSKELESSVKAELSGTTKDTQTLIDHMQQMNEAALSELQKQTPILDRILEAMKTSIKVQAAETPKAKMDAMNKGLGEIEASRLLELMGAGGKKVLESFISTDVGLPLMSAEEGGGPVAKRKITETSIKFSSEESRAQFEDVRARLKEAMDRAASAIFRNSFEDPDEYADAKMRPAERNQMPQANKDEILSLQKELLSNEDVVKAGKGKLGLYAKQEVLEKEQNRLKEIELRKQSLLNQIAAARARVMSQLTSAEQTAYAETDKSSRILQGVMEGLRLSEATMGFALAMDNLIKDFQKAEMLAYEKQGSDIEGAFARVGQPGFKTTFEQQREEIESRRGKGPRTLEEMQGDYDALDKLDFDEKEARIKETQDVEVSALRQQQSQAESIRSLLADQLMGGDLPSDLEGMTRNYLDTLTQELATSEQAQAGPLGEDLTFRGVPALDDARNFLQQIKEKAAEQARRAELQFQQQINQPMVDQLKTQTQIQMEIRDAILAGALPGAQLTGEGLMSGATGDGAYGGAPVGQRLSATAGMAPVSPDTMDWMGTLGAAGSPFELTGKNGGGLGDLKSLMGIEKSNPSAFNYSPSGMLKGMTGPLSFNDQNTTFADLAENQVGATNSNQVVEAANALGKGNRAYTTGAISTDSENGRTPGSQIDDVATGKATAGSEGQTEALASLSEQFSTLIEAINALASTPDQGSQEIVSAITDSSAAITELLGSTLTVNVENVPAVTVEGLEDALSGAFSSSGLGSVGSEVADARLRLEVLEGIIDPSGPSVEDRITAATEAISANLDVAGTTLTTLEESLGALTSQVEALAPLTDLDTQVTSLEEGVTTLTAQVETNTSAITSIQTNVDENANLVNELTTANADFQTSIDAVLVSNAETQTLVEEFETTIEDINTRVAAAEATVTAAAATVTDLQDSLTSLSTSIDSNRQLSEAADRELSNSLSNLETKITRNTTDIQTVRGKVETALSQAQQALNLARQPRK